MKRIGQSWFGYVYVLELNGFYKIGSSIDPTKRQRQLTTGTPTEPTLIYLLRTHYQEHVERRIHAHFANKRHRGEWFKLDENDVAYIKTLDSLGRTPDDEDYDGYPAESHNAVAFCVTERALMLAGLPGASEDEWKGEGTLDFILRNRETVREMWRTGVLR